MTTLGGPPGTWPGKARRSTGGSAGKPDVRTLNGGQQAAFTLTWSGTTSQPNCAGDRVPVPAGSYAVSAQFGSVHSSPETFNIS